MLKLVQSKFNINHPSENLVINSILKGEDIPSESLNISKFDIPSIWDAKESNFTSKLKKCLVYLKITLSSSVADDSMKEINEQCKQSLETFNKYPNFQNALAVFSLFGITNRKEAECFTLLFRALNPKMFEIKPHFQSSSELTDTSSLHANLFDIACVFENYERAGDQAINDLLGEESFVGETIDDIRPDDVLIRTYNNGAIECVKFVREDKPDNYPDHLKHPDFLKVVLIMRLSLSRTIRSLVQGDLTEAHQNIYVIGATTDSIRTNLYKLYAIITPTEEYLSYYLSYQLQYLGTYNHESSNTPRSTDRIELISQLLCYCFDPWYLDLCNQTTICLSASTTMFNIENTRFKFLKLHHIKGDSQKSVTKGSIQKDGYLNSSIDAICKNYTGQLYWEGFVLSKIQKRMLTLAVGMMKQGLQIFMLAGDSDLQEYTKKHSRFNESDAIQVLIDVLIQFEILEERKIVHNDIKPGNIVLFKKHWYLIDYELSKKYDSLDENGYCLQFGERISDHSGTEGYCAPEKESYGYISPKGDVYSLGISIQKLLNLINDKSALSCILSKMTRDSSVDRINVTECLNELEKLVEPGYIQSTKNHFLNNHNFTKSIISNCQKEE